MPRTVARKVARKAVYKPLVESAAVVRGGLRRTPGVDCGKRCRRANRRMAKGQDHVHH